MSDADEAALSVIEAAFAAEAQHDHTWTRAVIFLERFKSHPSRLALARALVPGWAVEEGWQPIATAPTNGTWVWCWHAERRWKRVGMRSKASGPRWYYSSTGFNAQYADDAPTHWRPLPADPAAEEPPHGP